MSNSSDTPRRKGVFSRATKAIFPARSEMRAHRRSLVLVMISALFGALIFHQNVLGALGWVAVVPLFIALHDLRGKLLFWATLAFGFIWYFLSAFWLLTLVAFHWLIPVGVMAGSVYMGAYFLLFAFPAAWCCRQLHPALRPWAVAVCWTGVEYLRNFTDMAFPWNLLGHSQAPWNIFFMQLAAVGGVSALSFIMALFNAVLAVWLAEPETTKRVLGRLLLSLIFTLVTIIAGYFPMFMPHFGSHPIWRLDVAIVQPGVSQLDKWNAMMGKPGDSEATYRDRWLATENLLLERLATLTRAAGKDKPQIIVMPESSFMSTGFPYAKDLQAQLLGLSQEVDADLFFGADNLVDKRSYERNAALGQRFSRPYEDLDPGKLPELPLRYLDNGTTAVDTDQINSMIPTVAAWHISRTSGLDARAYNKMQLVPFGEQVPFIQGVEWLQKKFELAGIAGAFRPGLENTIFQVQRLEGNNQPMAPIRFGAVICFESTFSRLTRNLALAGVNFICVITNDSWYDPSYAISQGGFWGTIFQIPGIKQLASAGPKQHLIQSQFRAIESGQPIVRSANTGISAFIDSSGEIINRIPYGESGYISTQLSHHADLRNPTLFVRYGEWLGKLCAGIWAALCCLLLITRPKSSGSRFALRK